MATAQTTVRVSERTEQQWHALAQVFGDKTKAMAVAIDRLYQSDIPAWIRQVVGHHNYYLIGAYEARDKVQEVCPPGWRVFVAVDGDRHIPAGGIRVGQVKAVHGDRAMPLYVMLTP